MEFRKAAPSDFDAIHQLYRSVVGHPMCTWDDEYPGMGEIQEDYLHNNLFVISQNNSIIGSISIVPKNELDELPLWQYQPACEIARVCVAPSYQNQGIANKMIFHTINTSRERKYQAIHLLAAAKNIPAQKLYLRNGFEYRGDCHMFGIDFLAFELLL